MSKLMELESAESEFPLSQSAHEASQLEPAAMTVLAEFGAVSHPGKVRVRNEDHFLVSRVSRPQRILKTNIPEELLPEQPGEDGYLFIVADGMGGMAGGDVASRLAISLTLKLTHRSEKLGFQINQLAAHDLLERMNRDLQEVDRTLTEWSEADRRLLGMGTTFTAAYSMGVDLSIIHLGDSRVYLCRHGSLQQLTKDHTVAQALADAGYISRAEVHRHAKRNVLTKYLGGHNGNVKADLLRLRLANGDRLLLCSDGLTEMVNDSIIARILDSHESTREATQALLEASLERGGQDNITIIVARYQIPELDSGGWQRTSERKSDPMSSTPLKPELATALLN
jgi:protein phosphatase